MGSEFESSVYQVDIQTTGEKQARDGARAVESVEVATDDLARASGRARDAMGRFTAGLGQMDKEAAHVAGSTRAAAAGVKDLGGGIVEAGSGFSASGHKLQVFAQGLDDLQYVAEQGLRPILNNIIQISPALGIAALGVQVLVTHWDDLETFFTGGSTKTEAEQMEELGKKTAKTADETARLLKYEEGRKHLEAQGKAPEAATKFGQAVNKAISEGPAGEIDKGLDKHFGDRIRQMASGDPRFAARDAAADEEIASHREAIRVARMNNNEELAAIIEPQLNKAIEKKNAVYGEAREAFRGELPTNPDRARKVADAARANPRDFGPNGERFASDLDAAIDPGGGRRGKIGAAFGDIVKKIREKLPKLAEEAQEKIDKETAERDNEAMAGEESGRQTDKFLRNLRKERAEKADKETAEKDNEEMAGDESMRQTQKFIKNLRRERADKLAEKVTAGTGLDARGEQAMLRSMLAGGSREQVTNRVAGGIAGELTAGGVEAGQAARIASEMVEKLYGKVGDEVHAKAMEQPEKRPVERIDVGDFARSVESGGNKKLETLTEQMKNELSGQLRTIANNINRVRGGN